MAVCQPPGRIPSFGCEDRVNEITDWSQPCTSQHLIAATCTSHSFHNQEQLKHGKGEIQVTCSTVPQSDQPLSSMSEQRVQQQRSRSVRGHRRTQVVRPRCGRGRLVDVCGSCLRKLMGAELVCVPPLQGEDSTDIHSGYSDTEDVSSGEIVPVATSLQEKTRKPSRAKPMRYSGRKNDEHLFQSRSTHGKSVTGGSPLTFFHTGQTVMDRTGQKRQSRGSKGSTPRKSKKQNQKSRKGKGKYKASSGSGGKKGKRRRQKVLLTRRRKATLKRHTTKSRPLKRTPTEADPSWRPKSYVLSPLQLRQVNTRARTAATHSPLQFRRAVMEAYRHSSTTEGLACAREILSQKRSGRTMMTPRTPKLQRQMMKSPLLSGYSSQTEASSSRQRHPQPPQQSATTPKLTLPSPKCLSNSSVMSEIARRTVARKELLHVYHRSTAEVSRSSSSGSTTRRNGATRYMYMFVHVLASSPGFAAACAIATL